MFMDTHTDTHTHIYILKLKRQGKKQEIALSIYEGLQHYEAARWQTFRDGSS